MNLLFTALYNLFSGSFEGLAEPSESPEMLLQNCRSFSQNGKRCCKIAWSLPETGNVVAKSQEAFPSRETLSQNCTKPSQVGKRCCKIAGSLPKSGNIVAKLQEAFRGRGNSVAKLHEAFRRAENGADFGIRKNSRKFEAKKNMVLSEKEKEFLRAHRSDDVARLSLQAHKYPDLNVRFLIEQIAARQIIEHKLPEWYANEAVFYPSRVSLEQCSSEVTARYKQALISEGDRLCDLTGGLGIDSYYFSKKAGEVIYVETVPAHFEMARQNFAALQCANVRTIHADCRDYLEQTDEQVDVFYIDPSRRNNIKGRVYALSDCEPNLVEMLPRLFERAPKVIAKLSPMLDISHTLQLLSHTTAIHVLSVRNECKELLFEIERDALEEEPKVYCLNFTSNGREMRFAFRLSDERDAATVLAAQPENYLYEPNASILKAGAFKSVARHYGIGKLHPSSHLYTSEQLINDFAGRIFKVEEVIPFSSKQTKRLRESIPQANITVRNFPLSAEQLRARLKIKEGGTTYLFATTARDGEKLLIRAAKVEA